MVESSAGFSISPQQQMLQVSKRGLRGGATMPAISDSEALRTAKRTAHGRGCMAKPHDHGYRAALRLCRTDAKHFTLSL